MYAIIRAGGKQAKVHEGDVLDVERIKDVGPEITFTPLLIVADDGTVVSDRAALDKAKVTATILGENRGEKIEVFKYKAKTGYRKRSGHRQTYSRIQVMKIDAPGKKAAAKKPAAKTATEKPAAKKPAAKAATEKPAAKAATEKAATEKAAAKKAAAKKPAAKKPATKKAGSAKTANEPKEGEEA